MRYPAIFESARVEYEVHEQAVASLCKRCHCCFQECRVVEVGGGAFGGDASVCVTWFVPRVEYEVQERAVMASAYGAVVLQRGRLRRLSVGITTTVSTHVLKPPLLNDAVSYVSC